MDIQLLHLEAKEDEFGLERDQPRAAADKILKDIRMNVLTAKPRQRRRSNSLTPALTSTLETHSEDNHQECKEFLVSISQSSNQAFRSRPRIGDNSFKVCIALC